MKTLFYIIPISLITFLMYSCTELVKMNYTETKTLPISENFNKPDGILLLTGNITGDDLKRIFDIPSDATLKKFTINGFTIQVNPSIKSESTIAKYTVTYKDNTDNYIRTLVSSQHDFSSTGSEYNVTSELNPQMVADLKCKLEYLLTKNNNLTCKISEITYYMSIQTIDGTGKPKSFQGNIRGDFDFQAQYEICQELPIGLFYEYDKCGK